MICCILPIFFPRMSKYFKSCLNCKHHEPLMCFFFCYWSKALFKLYNLQGPLINIDRVFYKPIDLKEFLRPTTLKNTFQQVPKLYVLTMELNHNIWTYCFSKTSQDKVSSFCPFVIISFIELVQIWKVFYNIAKPTWIYYFELFYSYVHNFIFTTHNVNVY